MKYEPGVFDRLEEKLGRFKKSFGRKAESNRVTCKLYRGFSFAGRKVHSGIKFVINNVTLTVVYFIGMTISFAVVRAAKKDIGFNDMEGSTWKRFEEKDKGSYVKQF